MVEFYVISYKGKRIPVVVKEGQIYGSSDGCDWSIQDGHICLDGVPVPPDQVVMSRLR
jgi:hypothetical protein